nr:uncharacterized protein LOC109182267 [Ipomoea batatas]
MLKLDMAKAYDWVSWFFLLSVMQRMEFYVVWIDFVVWSVSNIWYSVVVNGVKEGTSHIHYITHTNYVVIFSTGHRGGGGIRKVAGALKSYEEIFGQMVRFSKRLRLDVWDGSIGCCLNGGKDGVCISPGGRFPKFSNEGKPPRKVNKGPRDLNLCRVFRGKTCCDITQTHPTLLSIRRLASTGEASQECLHLWEMLECSICDPHVGVQPGPPVICASLCDRVYQACSNAYFAVDAKTQVLAPCGVNDFVCGRASEWISNGTELCRVAGFSVKSLYDDPEEVSCYGGKSSRDHVAKSWGGSHSKFAQTAQSSSALEDFKHWVEDMLFSERVSWAIGGMVLTAGLLFVSQRRNRRQRYKQAAIQRAAKKLNSGSPRGREARRQVEDK